jgi:DegV family protein with EDD domain
VLGSVLNINPLLTVVAGRVVPVEKVRTLKRALERLTEIALASGPIEEIAVVHAAAEEQARQVKGKLAHTFAEDRIVFTETGPVLGAHVGPGAVGIAWLSGHRQTESRAWWMI